MYKELLNALVVPIVMCDNEHTIVYMNKAAEQQYKKFGGSSILGKSIFDCHNDNSTKMILEVFTKMQDGVDEVMISENDKRKAFMTAVRDDAGQLIGYYERYEKK